MDGIGGGRGGGERRSGGYLPAGFRFHPTDEELIGHYLMKKVMDSQFSSPAIAHVDLNNSEPWDLPEKAAMGEKEWYFFSVRDRKYPTGVRTNRATEAGYWKATGKDREIMSRKTKGVAGMKKTLVFYKGRAPKGQKTNWVMHEFRLAPNFPYHFLSTPFKDEWVISKVFKKTTSGNRSATHGGAMKKSSLPTPEPISPNSYLSAAAFSGHDDPKEHELHVTCFSTSNLNSFDGGGSGGGSGPSASAFPINNLQENLQAAPLFSPMAPRHLLAGAGDLDVSGGAPAPGGYMLTF